MSHVNRIDVQDSNTGAAFGNLAIILVASASCFTRAFGFGASPRVLWRLGSWRPGLALAVGPSSSNSPYTLGAQRTWGRTEYN